MKDWRRGEESEYDRAEERNEYGGSARAAGTPGKRTLVDAVQRRATGAVQLRGTGAPAEAPLHELAERAAKTPGSRLPYLESIQRSFGRHDVSGVVAHVGTEAGRYTAAMGAEAFASGDQVAFAGAPSEHTAAHEAAHAVQQRAGVHLKGGVGEEGDPHERHADAVADRVVRGESAEDLLDQYATGAGGGGGGIQAKWVGEPAKTATGHYREWKQDPSDTINRADGWYRVDKDDHVLDGPFRLPGTKRGGTSEAEPPQNDVIVEPQDAAQRSHKRRKSEVESTHPQSSAASGTTDRPQRSEGEKPTVSQAQLNDSKAPTAHSQADLYGDDEYEELDDGDAAHKKFDGDVGDLPSELTWSGVTYTSTETDAGRVYKRPDAGYPHFTVMGTRNIDGIHFTSAQYVAERNSVSLVRTGYRWNGMLGHLVDDPKFQQREQVLVPTKKDDVLVTFDLSGGKKGLTVATNAVHVAPPSAEDLAAALGIP